jgi:hypothetical protein
MWKTRLRGGRVQPLELGFALDAHGFAQYEQAKVLATMDGSLATKRRADAATTIQSHFRGFRARKAYRQKQAVILELQAAFRGYRARKEAAQMAAVLSALRIHPSPPAGLGLDDRNRAASLLQRVWRGRAFGGEAPAAPFRSLAASVGGLGGCRQFP